MNFIEKLKKLMIAYIANNFKLSNKLTRVQNHLDARIESLLNIKSQNLEKIINTKFAESQKQFLSLESKLNTLLRETTEEEMLLLSKFVATREQVESKNQSVRKNHFLLLDYHKHIARYGFFNLGDYVQTIATHSALSRLFPNASYEYHDRDSLMTFTTSKATTSAGGGGNLTPVIMQGWFAFNSPFHFFPSCETLPIFVGTHFTFSAYQFLEYFVCYYPYYFSNKEIGCRDLETLRFCQRLGIQAYLSRCLTLTLPKREEDFNKSADKVFLVGIQDNLLEYIPQDLRQNAVKVNQQWVKVEESLNPRDYEAKTRTLLETYKKEAKLIITCALHCAAPCTAMGIPVVLIAKNQENINRFGAVEGILKIWSIEDLKARRVNFNPTAPNIESLKSNMLENLNLSIQKEFGESVDEIHLQAVRQAIAEFQAENLDALDSTTSAGGGGIFRT